MCSIEVCKNISVDVKLIYVEDLRNLDCMLFCTLNQYLFDL